MNTRRMNRTLRGAAGVAIAAFGIVALPQPASASGEIKIEADNVVTVTQGHYANTGQTVQLSRTVSYADLDLSTSAGASEFHNRIQSTAEQVCDQLRAFAPAGSACIVPGCSRVSRCSRGPRFWLVR